MLALGNSPGICYDRAEHEAQVLSLAVAKLPTIWLAELQQDSTKAVAGMWLSIAARPAGCLRSFRLADGRCLMRVASHLLLDNAMC